MHPYRGMKNFVFLFVAFMALAAGNPAQAEEVPLLFNWGLLWTGSWEENVKDSSSLNNPALSGTLHNRMELWLHFLPLDILLRGQILERRPVSLEFNSIQNGFQSDPDKTFTHLTGGLYHRPTGSRLLFGVIDEWGLPARIRSPWVRSPPYAENHWPIMADLRTAASSTREEEAYLYLSSPFLEFFPTLKARGFFSAQTETKNLAEDVPLQPRSAFSGGLDLRFAGSPSSLLYNLLLETFYTEATLAPKKSSAWFSDSPPLPEREFRLYAVGVLFTSPDFSVSSDFALSETFAWGTDIYVNLGISVTPLLAFGSRARASRTARERPLTISLAVDGAGERYVNRDGTNYTAGFRGAGKIEWRGRYNYLIRLDSVLRSPGPGEDFNRSSTGFYCRFPYVPANRAAASFPLRLTRISLSADRNAANPKKVSDSYSASIGLRLNMNRFNRTNFFTSSPLGITFSGTVKGLSELTENCSPYPIPNENWKWETAGINCELFWPPGNLQFRVRAGLSLFAEKEEKWDFSFSTAIRFKQGRLTLRAASPDFPDKWNWTISWRLEKQ